MGSTENLIMAVAQQHHTNFPEEDIRIRDLLTDLRNSKILALCLVGALTLAGVVYGVFRTPKYVASTVLMPVSNNGGTQAIGGLSSLASRYSSLASLAGINLPGGSAGAADIAVLSSELLTRQFVQKNNLLPVLFPKLWNPEQHKWKTNNPERVPSLWDAYRLFKRKIRQVTHDKKTGLIRLSITWKNPKVAAKWANELVALANNHLRQQAIDVAQRNIAYLQDQLKKAKLVEVQYAISSLLEEQINREMVARGRKEYALKVVDPAFAPGRPSTSGPILLGTLGFLSGCLLSVLVVFVRRVLRE
jgi:uncharacterized protein involved in exopolysaccharide biosynthesis